MSPPSASGPTGERSTASSKLPHPHWQVENYQWCLLCDLKATDREDDSEPLLCPSCQASVSS